MFYQNISQTFYTDAADRPTSKYFVCANGLIRAKTAIKTLHIRPGKNICFTNVADGSDVLEYGVKSVKLRQDGDLDITLKNNAQVRASKVHSVQYNNPVDFYLDQASGNYESGRHVGHTIVNQYNGRDSGISEQQINDRAAQFIQDGQITGAKQDVPIVEAQ